MLTVSSRDSPCRQTLVCGVAAESLSLVIKNQVEMRAMLNNIPIRLRNSKSCTREAILRALFRERVSAWFYSLYNDAR